MAGFSIRDGRPADLDAIFELDCLCFEAPFRFSRRTMNRFTRSSRAITLISDFNDEPAGFVIVERTGTSAYVVTLDVHPTHRRNGVAQLLMHAAEFRMAHTGADTMSLHVAEQNLPAIAFYHRAGYIASGRSPDYYAAGLDALEYSKSLT